MANPFADVYKELQVLGTVCNSLVAISSENFITSKSERHIGQSSYTYILQQNVYMCQWHDTRLGLNVSENNSELVQLKNNLM